MAVPGATDAAVLPDDSTDAVVLAVHNDVAFVRHVIHRSADQLLVTPRGIRNSNPGNIRRSRDAWQGLSDSQLDAEFLQFTAPKWGVRAIAKILVNYDEKHGLRTVRKIINRWAPPVENQTDAYVRVVADALGVQPDDEIDVRREIVKLVTAIIRHENGMQPYRASDIAEWCQV